LVVVPKEARPRDVVVPKEARVVVVPEEASLRVMTSTVKAAGTEAVAKEARGLAWCSKKKTVCKWLHSQRREPEEGKADNEEADERVPDREYPCKRGPQTG
jgi:hypothetical protein